MARILTLGLLALTAFPAFGQNQTIDPAAAASFRNQRPARARQSLLSVPWAGNAKSKLPSIPWQRLLQGGKAGPA